MKTLMGVKMIEIQDVLKLAGNRTPLCDYIKHLISQGNNVIEDIDKDSTLVISLAGRLNMLNPYRLVFIPLEVAEEMVFNFEIARAMSTAKEVIITASQANRADEVINRYENSLANITDRYKDFDSIYGTTCVMCVYDEEKIEEVILANPPIIMEGIVNKPTEYQCVSCGKVEKVESTNIDNFLPAMRYEVEDRKVKYYCKDCCDKNKKLQKLKRVGE